MKEFLVLGLAFGIVGCGVDVIPPIEPDLTIQKNEYVLAVGETHTVLVVTSGVSDPRFEYIVADTTVARIAASTVNIAPLTGLRPDTTQLTVRVTGTDLVVMARVVVTP